MSTRAAIARPTNGTDEGIAFEGVYHHWDGYPTGLGATLFELYNGHFGRDLEAMTRFLIDDHPAGWSTINDKDLSRAPGFSEMGWTGTCVCGRPESEHYCQSIKDHPQPKPCAATYNLHLGHSYEPDAATIALAADKARIPECYCHGDRNEEAWKVTEQDASGSGVEWVYLLRDTPDGAYMLVLSSYVTSGQFAGQKMIGAFGMGDPDAKWKPVAIVGLDSNQAPDWEAIESGSTVPA